MKEELAAISDEQKLYQIIVVCASTCWWCCHIQGSVIRIKSSNTNRSREKERERKEAPSSGLKTQMMLLAIFNLQIQFPSSNQSQFCLLQLRICNIHTESTRKGALFRTSLGLMNLSSANLRALLARLFCGIEFIGIQRQLFGLKMRNKDIIQNCHQIIFPSMEK